MVVLRDYLTQRLSGTIAGNDEKDRTATHSLEEQPTPEHLNGRSITLIKAVATDLKNNINKIFDVVTASNIGEELATILSAPLEVTPTHLLRVVVVNIVVRSLLNKLLSTKTEVKAKQVIGALTGALLLKPIIGTTLGPIAGSLTGAFIIFKLTEQKIIS